MMASVTSSSRKTVSGRRMVMSFCDMVGSWRLTVGSWQRISANCQLPTVNCQQRSTIWRLLVVEEPERHALGVVQEVLRQRVERAGKLDGLLRREVVRRNAGAAEDRHVADPSVAMDGDADEHHASQAGLDDLRHVVVPVHPNATDH